METTEIITATKVPQDQRLIITEQLFSLHFPLRLEPVIYSISEKMAPAYQGGYWDFFTLDNGGFYMAPGGDQRYQVSCDNYFQGELSADALGITACLYAYSHLSFLPQLDFARLCADHYHRLHHFMCEHEEVASILRAID